MSGDGEPRPRKRKLPSVGIYDPNFSEDPQYGNVSTLKDGWKRVHIHVDGPQRNDTDFIRLQIIIPECTIPTIRHDKIDSIDEIEVVILKNFECDAMMSTVANKEDMIIGICDVDNFNLTPCPNLDERLDPVKIPLTHLEALFITNRPVAYKYHGPYKNWISVSNMAERGYVLMQNYFNVFTFHNRSANEDLSFNLYVDYQICKMKYRDALAWRADFEKLVNPLLRYRVGELDNKIIICSRGEFEGESVDDPSTFNPIVKSSKCFKVAERQPVNTLTEHAALSEYLQKYFKNNK